ncbi:MAG: TIGR02594 family protein [Methylococcaceae bacterium]|nr:MAG: TIGR02594 family protein [Methylococcaceae bacterium]
MSNLIVNASSLNLRDAPSKTDGNIIGVLHRGDIVESINNAGDTWANIKTSDGKTGWASSSYLKDTIATSSQHFPWFERAIEEYNKHIKEVAGSGDNPRIVEYLRSTNLDSISASNDETAWCSAFVNWCVEQSGCSGTDSAWARSWLSWGKETDMPVKGCIAVFKRPPNPSSGHVAFFVSHTDTHVKVLGGNQSDSVSVADYPADRLLSYRIPN